MTLEVFPLSVGDLQLDTSFVNWQTDCGVKNWYPTTAWLIKGGDKLILVDTSFRSTSDAAAHQGLTARRNPEQEIAPQLASLGVTPNDVQMIIHTHVHMDHAGQDYLFPNARILVQREELRNAAAPDIYPIPFYDRRNVALLIDQLWPQVDVLDGECEPVPGIRCVPLPGHTPGHQAIYVATTSGNTIICGDAAMNVAVNVQKQVAPGFLDNMGETMKGLRGLRSEGVHVLPTHDGEVFSKYPSGVR